MKSFVTFAVALRVSTISRAFAQTIEADLPGEAAFLQRYDQFAERVQAMIDMPGPTIDLLFRFLQQNDGALSKRAREKEFAALSDGEAKTIEDIYAQIFSE